MGQEVGWPVVIEPPQRPVSVRLYRLGLGRAMTGRSHERLPYLTVRVTMGYGQLLAGLANVHEQDPDWAAGPMCAGHPVSLEVRGQQVRDSVLDLVPMVAVLAEERALQDLIFLDIDPELQIPFAHGAAQDLHEVSLHPSRERERLT